MGTSTSGPSIKNTEIGTSAAEIGTSAAILSAFRRARALGVGCELPSSNILTYYLLLTTYLLTYLLLTYLNVCQYGT